MNDFIDNVRDELRAMREAKIISQKRCLQALDYIAKHPEDFTDEAGLSASQAADLALDLAKFVAQYDERQVRS